MPPQSSIWKNCTVQSNQPNACPYASSSPYKVIVLDTRIGYAPMPLGVMIIAMLPLKSTAMEALMPKPAVSVNAYMPICTLSKYMAQMKMLWKMNHPFFFTRRTLVSPARCHRSLCGSS